jgi:hypothetical protein
MEPGALDWIPAAARPAEKQFTGGDLDGLSCPGFAQARESAMAEVGEGKE